MGKKYSTVQCGQAWENGKGKRHIFKKPGRGWHGRTVELEPALGGGNGSYRASDPLPPPRAASSGRSGEVARVKAFFHDHCTITVVNGFVRKNVLFGEHERGQN